MQDDMNMDLDVGPEPLEDLVEEAGFDELETEMSEGIDAGMVEQARAEVEAAAMSGAPYDGMGEALEDAGYELREVSSQVLEYGKSMAGSEGEAVEQLADEDLSEVQQIDEIDRSEIERAVSEMQSNDEIRVIHPYADSPQCPTCGTKKDESLEEGATHECAMCGRSFVKRDTWQSVEELELEQLFRYMGLRSFKR